VCEDERPQPWAPKAARRGPAAQRAVLVRYSPTLCRGAVAVSTLTGAGGANARPSRRTTRRVPWSVFLALMEHAKQRPANRVVAPSLCMGASLPCCKPARAPNRPSATLALAPPGLLRRRWPFVFKPSAGRHQSFTPPLPLLLFTFLTPSSTEPWTRCGAETLGPILHKTPVSCSRPLQPDRLPEQD